MTSKSNSQYFVMSILDIFKGHETWLQDIISLILRNIKKAWNDLTFFYYVLL